MACLLSAKNYWNQTTTVKMIVEGQENVVDDAFLQILIRVGHIAACAS